MKQFVFVLHFDTRFSLPLFVTSIPDNAMLRPKIYQKIFSLPLIALLLFVNIKAIAQTDDATDKYFEISKNLEIFSNLFKELNTYYVDPIQPGKMVKTGIDAMLSNLDPYTNFITEADIEDFEFQTTGRYGGIGAAIRYDKDSNVVIAEPYENSPITKAGIKAGDIIESVDGNMLKGKSNEQLAPLMKGSPGTKLTMVVVNPVTGKKDTKTITREEIKVSSVPFTTLVGKDKNIAYVSLTQFTQNCSRDMLKALDSLKAAANNNLKGIVIDLRGNPGGLLDEAVAICNLFLNRGQLVVQTKGKNQTWNKDFHTENAPWDLDVPLAVLVNHGSASASEIVSGTMQDLDRGVIIGTRSYGKGLVQVVRPLGYNTQLKVTTAKYYTPSGRCIQVLDYSHRNPDGSVSAVPDSLKRAFKTKNGRVVYDGGGIEPDIVTEESEPGKITQALVYKGLIFDYATKYYYEHPAIASPQDFKLSDADFADFENWLNNKDYSYKTDNELELEKIKTSAEKDKAFEKIKLEYNALEAKLAHDKKQELDSHKPEVCRLLANEIVSRYYFQKGRVVNRLYNGDSDMQKALSVLDGDGKEYKSVLHQ